MMVYDEYVVVMAGKFVTNILNILNTILGKPAVSRWLQLTLKVQLNIINFVE